MGCLLESRDFPTASKTKEGHKALPGLKITVGQHQENTPTASEAQAIM